ncbi:WYL domain-containing protein [Neorhodopirellula lusitana]|uniref:hypothetical protein n=1 Tax=Neorhodopirellula lusitana TaxID=445327 RepID=UPI00384F4E39
MLGFLKTLFSDSVGSVDAYWLETAIRLPRKVRTLSGGNVTIVTACVDVNYAVNGNEITITGASLSRSGGLLGPRKINVSAQRTGEAWYATSLPVSNASLREASQVDLEHSESRLRRIIFGKAGERHRRPTDRSSGTRFDLSLDLIHALNSHASVEEVQEVLDSGSIHSHITFQYKKADGRSRKRRVVVHGTKGRSIAATDKSDKKRKHFRIDRISNAKVDS